MSIADLRIAVRSPLLQCCPFEDLEKPRTLEYFLWTSIYRKHTPAEHRMQQMRTPFSDCKISYSRWWNTTLYVNSNRILKLLVSIQNPCMDALSKFIISMDGCNQESIHCEDYGRSQSRTWIFFFFYRIIWKFFSVLFVEISELSPICVLFICNAVHFSLPWNHSYLGSSVSAYFISFTLCSHVFLGQCHAQRWHPWNCPRGIELNQEIFVFFELSIRRIPATSRAIFSCLFVGWQTSSRRFHSLHKSEAELNLHINLDFWN